MHDSRSVWRVIVVTALAIWAVGINVPQVFQFWHAFGAWPFVIGPNAAVQGVVAGSPAAQARLRDGDRLDWARVAFEDRVKCGLSVVASPGTTCTLPVLTDGHVNLVTVASDPLPFTYRDAIVAVLAVLGTAFFVAVAAALVLLRPSPITWAFFACSVWYNSGNDGFFLALLPPLQAAIQELAMPIVIGFSTWGVFYFGLMFPSGAGGSVRLAAARWSWIIGVLVAVPDIVILQRALFTGSTAPPGFSGFSTIFGPVDFVLVPAVVLLSVVAMIVTFANARGLDRQRVQWVLPAFALGLAVEGGLLILAPLASIIVPIGVTNALISLSFLPPLAVAYTVIVHRVFDIRFVISHALVYGILTAALVALFAAMDWFFGRVLAQSKLALVAELAAAIGLGFWFNGLHSAVDKFIDATLFRARHRAEQRLSRAAAAVAHLNSVEAVEEMLASDPADALGLASAAVFRLANDNSFHRRAVVNWPAATTNRLGSDDRLVAELRGTQNPLRVVDVRWSESDLPQGAARPVLAVPLSVRHELRAIALYGAHASGEDIDPDEVKAIEILATMASAAFDHLEALELRREVESLRLQLAAFQAKPAQA